ncbi:MAG: AAA family ATPase [Oscillospiraceae bacterium]|nr:AAA family ATPase [Oscillospiraceae bacterium]
MPNTITMLLNLTNIGPHIDTRFSECISSVNTAIYADNGSGKSFISKSFKRVGEVNSLDAKDLESIEDLQHKSRAMIRFGEKKGNMTFSVIGNDGSERNTSIEFKSDALPTVTDHSGLIYHVFNSEYVKENLEAVKYHPEDKVTGFILGKVNIDLRKEKEDLSKLENSNNQEKAEIAKEIHQALADLRSLEIQPNTNEYKQITYENLKSDKTNAEKRSFESVLEKYKLLLGMPDNITDVEKQLVPDEVNLKQALGEATSILGTTYSLGHFEEDFKQSISSKRSFIENGIELSKDGVCPFCGQPYNDDAIALIEKYTSFLQDAEAKTIKHIEKVCATLISYCEQLEKSELRFGTVCKQYDNIRKFFPSYNDKEMSPICVDTLKDPIKSLIRLLESKSSNIAKEAISISSEIANIEQLLKKLTSSVEENNYLATAISATKNNTSSERLTLRKALCNAKYNALLITQAAGLKQIQDNVETIKSLKEIIDEKESQARIDKRQLLIKELKTHLSLFFKGKYEFDEDHFCIKFQNNSLVENADDVLSDGEKSILAFCFYLANIHAVIQKESDYDRLLLIIDDPVSSMDFNYVYNVAQAIRNLKKIEHMGRVRFIVLTHNMEFMSMLVRNKIVKQKYIFSHGVFRDFKNLYVMPYMANLIDIYQVAAKTVQPNYTVPNSLRHILETIYRFEGSVGQLDDYILQDEILKENGFLFSLIEDHSHGGFREEIGYTDDMLIDACSTVIAFIKKKYPGQIDEIEKLTCSE